MSQATGVALWRRFRIIVEAIPRRACMAELAPIVTDLAALRDEVDKLLEFTSNPGIQAAITNGSNLIQIPALFLNLNLPWKKAGRRASKAPGPQGRRKPIRLGLC